MRVRGMCPLSGIRKKTDTKRRHASRLWENSNILYAPLRKKFKTKISLSLKKFDFF